MNLSRPELANLLAGEYVLGTLRGPARRRFERAMRDDPRLADAVNFWDQALAGLLPEEELAPSRDLWPNIEQQLGWQQTAQRSRPPIWAMLAFAAVAGISILLWAPWQPRFVPDMTVAMADEDGHQWQLAVDSGKRWLEVQVLDSPDVPSDRDLELWLLVEGSDPISLGLVAEDDGARQRILTQANLRSGYAFALSVEPQGGSPTGLPTGPVIAVGEFSAG